MLISDYKNFGQTISVQLSPGHFGLPSSGQHLFAQSLINPFPAMFFSCSLESFDKFFMLNNFLWFDLMFIKLKIFFR
jgi:hypothetical protein